MFHASVGEAGNHHHVILRERKRLGEVGSKILDALRCNLLHLRSLLLRLLEFGTADVEAGQSCRLNLAEWPRGKSEQVGADGTGLGKAGEFLPRACCLAELRGGIGNHCPVFRCGQFQMEAAFDIRLVETWKGHAGVHGNKQGVEVFRVVILVFKAGDGLACRSHGRSELNADGVQACLKEIG